MTVPYGDGERFPYSGFLVLNNRIVACLCAAAILLYKVRCHDRTRKHTLAHTYAQCSENPCVTWRRYRPT